MSSLLIVFLDLNAKNWSDDPNSGRIEHQPPSKSSSGSSCNFWDVVNDIMIIFSHQLTRSGSSKIGLVVYDESGADVLFPDGSNSKHNEIISQFDLDGLNEVIVSLLINHLKAKKITSSSNASALDEALFKGLLCKNAFPLLY